MSENASTPPATGDAGRARRKTRVGVVVSDKMDKTIVVSVVRRVPHPKFGKIIKKTTKLYAADDKSDDPTHGNSPCPSLARTPTKRHVAHYVPLGSGGCPPSHRAATRIVVSPIIVHLVRAAPEGSQDHRAWG